MPVELPAQRLRTALAVLAARDPRLAEDAEAAIDSLAWRESEEEPAVFGQHALQLFLWYVLPCKWDAPADELLAVAHALGDLLEQAGAPARYVALCRSPETERMIRTEGEGFAELLERSGLEPPDTPLLAWSDLMTMEEADERAAAALALEDALERGELTPGAPGWRERQQEVLERFLRQEGPDGSSPLARIYRARIDEWLDPPGLPEEVAAERRARLETVLPLLEGPPDGEEAALALDPLLWLLDLCEQGAPLTQTRALARSLVREAVERYPVWWLAELRGQPQREADVRPLELLHELALALRLVRRRGRELRLTARGRELRAKPLELLHAVAGELAARASLDAELVLAALLAPEARPPGEELPILAAVQADALLAPLAGAASALWDRRYVLSEGGRTLARAILRARAVGARRFAL